jgi:hypothetical protein
MRFDRRHVSSLYAQQARKARAAAQVEVAPIRIVPIEAKTEVEPIVLGALGVVASKDP